MWPVPHSLKAHQRPQSLSCPGKPCDNTVNNSNVWREGATGAATVRLSKNLVSKAPGVALAFSSIIIIMIIIMIIIIIIQMMNDHEEASPDSCIKKLRIRHEILSYVDI
ncbi:hypothetical protein EYF80_013215 [Liparis tanakae]|uniref:Uncharacterized protein n=1 Tax=Liparis tanakae TaxID=230148 RepID=A0A4Z2IFZ3_9TELE|nr:hypothetical protein EYF80_013215 [Liparis tanakae]